MRALHGSSFCPIQGLKGGANKAPCAWSHTCLKHQKTKHVDKQPAHTHIQHKVWKQPTKLALLPPCMASPAVPRALFTSWAVADSPPATYGALHRGNSGGIGGHARTSPGQQGFGHAGPSWPAASPPQRPAATQSHQRSSCVRYRLQDPDAGSIKKLPPGATRVRPAAVTACTSLHSYGAYLAQLLPVVSA